MSDGTPEGFNFALPVSKQWPTLAHSNTANYASSRGRFTILYEGWEPMFELMEFQKYIGVRRGSSDSELIYSHIYKGKENHIR